MKYYQNKLKELRQDNDKTQTDIAHILNTTQSYYTKYENEKTHYQYNFENIMFILRSIRR